MNAFVLYLSGKICILLWVLSIKVVNIVDIAVVHLMKLSFSGIIGFAPLDPSKNKNRKHLKSCFILVILMTGNLTLTMQVALARHNKCSH